MIRRLEILSWVRKWEKSSHWSDRANRRKTKIHWWKTLCHWCQELIEDFWAIAIMIRLIYISVVFYNFQHDDSYIIFFLMIFDDMNVIIPILKIGNWDLERWYWWNYLQGSSGDTASLVAQLVKNLPAVRKTRVRSLGWEDPLEKEMETHSSILARKISRTGEPGGLQSMGRVGHNWVTNS